MSDEEVEKFEITDYDLENEFNINRPRRRLTKHQQIYGIWACDSDDEGYGNKMYSAHASRKNYSAPVSFVSGGVQQLGKKEESGNKTEEEEAGTSSKTIAATSSEDSEDEEDKQIRKMGQKGSDPIGGELAGFRRPQYRNPALIERGVGSWEKHTKGIGAKLLLQMGFQPGKGLGKALQGIAAPVEACQRKGRGSIGAYGPEKGTAARPDSGEKADKAFIKKRSQWRCYSAEDKRKKIHYTFKSIDEVIKQGKLKPGRKYCSSFSNVKVIDMTGPQQRVLSGYHAIAGQRRPLEEWEVSEERKFSNFALPELKHNMNILMELCEQDIVENDHKLRFISDRMITLKQESLSLTAVIDHGAKQIMALEHILQIIESMMDFKNYEFSLEAAADHFREIQNKYYEEYVLYDIGNIAVHIVAPLVKEKLKSWEPLVDPTAPISLFHQWKDILEADYNSAISAPYHKLLWDSWMPSVRIAVNSWNCRCCEPLIELLEHWLPVIPLWILENIREHLVIPRMLREVEEWNPLTDTVPIHAWIHPWIPLLGARLEPTVYPIIRQKLSKALVIWHPSDPSAKHMLLPWHKIFAKRDMNAFLVKNILPKLQVCLQEFVINPHEQHLDQWKWVMAWEDLLPSYSLANLLERFFFPNWLQVLTFWLNYNPNYDAICTWYMGWKGMFSESLLAEPCVKEQFRKALDMMNRAVLRPGQIVTQALGAIESVSYLTNLEQTNHSAPTAHERETRFEGPAEVVRTLCQIPQGFKELVQKHCEERGILFVPLPNRYHEGKQVYRCGKVLIYIDRHVVFISENGTVWRPTSLSAVLDLAV